MLKQYIYIYTTAVNYNLPQVMRNNLFSPPEIAAFYSFTALNMLIFKYFDSHNPRLCPLLAIFRQGRNPDTALYKAFSTSCLEMVSGKINHPRVYMASDLGQLVPMPFWLFTDTVPTIRSHWSLMLHHHVAQFKQLVAVSLRRQQKVNKSKKQKQK